MASISYVTSQDMAIYLRDVPTAPNADVWKFFGSVISRWIDEATGTYFYSDIYETKWFDGGDYQQQGNTIDFGMHPCYGKVGNIATCTKGATSLTYTPFRGPVPNNGEVITVDNANTQEQVTVSGAPTNNGDGTWGLTLSSGTQFAHASKTATTNIGIQLAYFENQPIANWTVQLSGDGVRPPSNYFLWPRNPTNAGATADPTQRKPWEGVDIARIPISSTTYLPSPIPGYLTIAVAANWGWPVVPDLIKDFVGRTVTKMWRTRGTGWSETLGSAKVGQVQHILTEIGALDEFLLLASSYKRIAI